MTIFATGVGRPEIARMRAISMMVRLLLCRAAMGEPSFVDGDASGAIRALDIASVEAPIVLCTESGMVLAATDPALALLRPAEAPEERPAEVPQELWRLLERSTPGDAVEWRPPGKGREVVGCTRYAAANGSYLLLMREVSAKHLALSERLNRQRVATTERLVASIAHDIRSSIASVVYSADFLNGAGSQIAPAALSETVRDISRASANLQQIVDVLLDYAHLGPNVSMGVPLREVLTRAVGALRVQSRDVAHRLRMDIAPRAEWVRGNPLVIEQILGNLLVNAVEASIHPRCIIVTAFPAVRPGSPPVGAPFYVCVRVWDDGPGIPPELRPFVFEPFFTTKPGSAGLGLAIARQATESLNGVLELSDDDTGTCFSLFLPGLEGKP